MVQQLYHFKEPDGSLPLSIDPDIRRTSRIRYIHPTFSHSVISRYTV